MSEPNGPVGVRQTDGRVESFDADRICGVLFAVGEGLGRPDAFLARELTDGVVHFLNEEYDGETPRAEDIREVVVKIVRELGHPRLAGAYETHTAPRPQPPRKPDPPLFGRELMSAHEEGLLVLGGLDAPTKLAARVLPWPRAGAELGRVLGDGLVLDGPEHWLLHVGMSPEEFVRTVAGFPCVFNLNISTPPSSVGAVAPGPLFGEATPGRPGDVALRLVELVKKGSPLRIAWHLTGSTTDRRLAEVVRLSVDGAPVEFVFDRSKRGIHLAEGVDREVPDLLLRVGVRLPHLLGERGQEPDAESLLSRVGTLARLALSAGVQKRAHLRRSGILTEGFVLDRARLQVIPVGLGETVERMTGRSLVSAGPALDLGRRIVRTLRDTLRTDGSKLQLAACLDEPPPGMLDAATPVLGVRDYHEPAPRRVRAATLLQELSERGAFPVSVSSDTTVSVPRILGALAEVAITQIDRVRLVHPEVAS
jgi:hypothetical protein